MLQAGASGILPREVDPSGNGPLCGAPAGILAEDEDDTQKKQDPTGKTPSAKIRSKHFFDQAREWPFVQDCTNAMSLLCLLKLLRAHAMSPEILLDAKLSDRKEQG